MDKVIPGIISTLMFNSLFDFSIYRQLLTVSQFNLNNLLFSIRLTVLHGKNGISIHKFSITTSQTIFRNQQWCLLPITYNLLVTARRRAGTLLDP